MTSSPKHLHVVGAGLIGGSAALAARAGGWVVTVTDADEASATWIRQQLTARTPVEAAEDPSEVAGSGRRSGPDIVLIAVPPAATAKVVVQALKTYVYATVTDTASIKAQPVADVEAMGGDVSRYVPGHPIAGSERVGAIAARADLFAGRTWVVCDGSAPDGRHEEVVRLVRDCRATPFVATPEQHDAALALTSHLPQVVASALATLVERAVVDGGRTQLDVGQVVGPALLEMTRIAASPPDLWAAIATANAANMRGVLRDLIDLLEPYAAALATSTSAAEATRSLVGHGNRGRRLIAGKHGRRVGPGPSDVVPRLGAGEDESWIWVDVVVPDKPGALARLFAAAGELGINIEDLHVDHAPHSPAGVVTLAVRARDAERLRAAFETDS